jgi:SPOR domain
MSDARKTKRSAPGDFDDLVDIPQRTSEDSRLDDPLAELARLIEEDPFADFNQRRREPPLAADRTGGGRTFTEPPVEIEDDRYVSDDDRYQDEVPSGYDQDYEEPAEYADDQADQPAGDPDYGAEFDEQATERLYADLAAAANLDVEPASEPQARDEPSHYADIPDDWAGQDVEPAPAPQARDEPSRYADIPDDWAGQDFDPAAALEEQLVAKGPDIADLILEDLDAAEAEDPNVRDPRGSQYGDDLYARTDPVFDDSGHLPPYEGDVPAEPVRRGRSLKLLLALIVLLAIGGGGYYLYDNFAGTETGGPPPIIRAEDTPAKIAPTAAQTEEPTQQQGKLVYDRVGGDAAADNAQLVPREEPVADLGERKVRVIEPGQEDQAAGLRGSASETASGTDASGDTQPKRVRTVVVKPDGTIVGEIEPPKSAAPVQPLQPAAAQPAPASEPVPMSAPAAEPTPESATAEPSGPPLPRPRPADLPVSKTSAAAPAAPATAPVAPAPAPAAFVPPAAPQASQPVALKPDADASLPTSQQRATGPSQPVQVAASQPAAAAVQTTTFPAGSFVVQVAATRSESDARQTAATIGQQYARQLSSFKPAVERADLGDRGIYYRVGIGPMRSQNDANSLCGNLKSAGLDCFVRRN